MRRLKPMTTYQDVLVKMIELKRIDQQLTLDHLLEDITSTRSYYRYLKLEADMPLRVVGLLCHKLNLNVSDLLDYAKTSDFKDFHLGRYIRSHRLKSIESLQQSKETLNTLTLSSIDLDLIDNMERHQKRNQVLSDYFETLFSKDALEPKKWLHSHIRYLMPHLFLEFVIEYGYHHLHDLNKLAYVIEYLHQIKPTFTDHYIHYPLSLFEAHCYQHQQDRCQEALIKHVSNHFFFDQGIPVSNYIKTLEKSFHLDIHLLFKETFLTTFQ